MEQSPEIVALDIESCTPLQKERAHLLVTLKGRHEARSMTIVVVLGVDVETLTEKNLADVRPSSVRRLVKRGLAKVIDGVDSGASLQQRRERSRPPVSGRR